MTTHTSKGLLSTGSLLNSSYLKFAQLQGNPSISGLSSSAGYMKQVSNERCLTTVPEEMHVMTHDPQCLCDARRQTADKTNESSYMPIAWSSLYLILPSTKRGHSCAQHRIERFTSLSPTLPRILARAHAASVQTGASAKTRLGTGVDSQSPSF
eukprot:6087971-Amphidinium_carterae.1